jgi:hypothetical protein
MTTWLLRGLVFAAGMVLLRLVQGTLINTYPTNAGPISLVLVVLFGVLALLWGLLDGIADARANPDPDRRRDLAMRWLLAGLLAGVLSGAVVWALSLVFPNLYAEGLVAEVTTFSAFTALLVFLPAMIGSGAGRWLVDRARPDEPRRRGAAGSDVFEAVRDDAVPVAVGAVDYPDEDVTEVRAARREESWRQESREAVRDVHETVQQRKYDLNREHTED